MGLNDGYNEIKDEIDNYLNDTVKDSNNSITLLELENAINEKIICINDCCDFSKIFKNLSLKLYNCKRIYGKNFFGDKEFDKIEFYIDNEFVNFVYIFKDKQKKEYKYILHKKRNERDMFVSERDGNNYRKNVFSNEEASFILNDYDLLLDKAIKLEKFFDDLRKYNNIDYLSNLKKYMKYIDLDIWSYTSIFSINIKTKYLDSTISPKIILDTNIKITDHPPKKQIINRKYVYKKGNGYVTISLKEILDNVLKNKDIKKFINIDLNKLPEYDRFLVSEYKKNNKDKKLKKELENK